MFGLVGVGVLVLMMACRDSGTGLKDPEDLDFDAVTGVDLSAMTKTSSGLYWQDLTPGTGVQVAAGDTVTVHYTGWLHDGTKFDSSVDRGTPFEFILGAGMVIQGWDEGVAGMAVGGKRKLVIPPALGYGSARSGSIPGGSTLVFDVELLSVRGDGE